MIVAISIPRILDTVYAFSAVTAASDADSVPTLLTKHEDPALRTFAYHCLCRMAVEICPILKLEKEVENPEEAEIIRFEAVFHNGDALGATLRYLVETALTGRILEALWQPVSARTATMYGALADTNLATLRRYYATKEDCRIIPSE